MDYECRAISLLCHKYGEGAVIAKVFTEELGLKSFSIKRSGGRKSKNKLSLLESQFLINISGKNNKKKQIQYLNEINLAYAFQDNTFKKTDEISEIFNQIIDLKHNNLVFSCGSGVTACVLALAYSIVNNTYSPKIYDGSWAEYGKI